MDDSSSKDTKSTQQQPSASVDSTNENGANQKKSLPVVNETGDSSSKPKESSKSTSPWMRMPYFVMIHILVVAIYAIPVFSPSEYNKRGNAVLDELHIVSADNHDVNGRENELFSSILKNVFSNDYWGRPMNSPSSHKSWRPLSVLSFRFLRGFPNSSFADPSSAWAKFWSSDLNVHRLVNIITHATIAELVSIVATKLCVTTIHLNDEESAFLLRCLTKILWALHPTHVEVTANAANRPHLFALMCSLLLSDPDTPWIVFLLSLVAGYLSCETFLFQVVPAAVTMVAIQYVRFYHGTNQVSHFRTRGLLKQVVVQTIWRQSRILVRVLLLGLSGIAYYAGRYYFNTLSIPTGLIRPAENPFYEFSGWHRVRNYAYVLSVHIAKQWDLDFIGFSHEYGFECIQSIKSWNDRRLLIPVLFVFLHVFIGIILLARQLRRFVASIALILYIVHLAWMLTLFPVAGLIKVGTFIADRIVVASTVSVSIVLANAAARWIAVRPRDSKYKRQRLLVLGVLAMVMWNRVYQRSCEWLDSLPLLESGLKTCPRFAKAHLEISKIYSGLYPDKFDLKKSRWHLEQAERIDPNYCDVHQQFAHVSVQEQKYLEFEERLTNSLLCPFTMGGSIDLWKRYWTMALDDAKQPPSVVEAAQARYQKYQKIINKAIVESDDKDTTVEEKSPLVGWHRSSEL